MILTTKGRYAVMAMADIFMNNGDGKAIPLSDIAKRQDITVAYLEQIFSKLKAKKLVKSIRGSGGGYLLAKDKISIADIIISVEERVEITKCSHSSDCKSNKTRCLTHTLWQGLSDNIYSYLRSISLEDLCKR